MQIYWIKDKQKQAPTSVPEIISMLQRGEITENSLGWHKGCEKWLPMKELPALQSFFEKPELGSEANPIPNTPTATDSAEAEAAAPKSENEAPGHVQVEAAFSKSEIAEKLQAGKPLLYSPSPIQRFLARILDCSIYAAIYMAIIYWREIPFDISLIPNNPLIWLAFIPVEAALLCRFRTTPGKALLGMKLYSFAGEKDLGAGRMLRRSMLVFCLGMGMMLMGFPFPLTLLALFLSYRRLKKDQITIWDMKVQTILLQRVAPTRGRCFFAGILIYLCINLTSFFMQPWMPSLLQEMREVSPDTAAKFEQFMPAELQNQTTESKIGEAESK